jgi:hypothetical protein
MTAKTAAKPKPFWMQVLSGDLAAELPTPPEGVSQAVAAPADERPDHQDRLRLQVAMARRLLAPGRLPTGCPVWSARGPRAVGARRDAGEAELTPPTRPPPVLVYVVFGALTAVLLARPSNTFR